MLTFQRRLFSTGSRPRWSGQNVVEKIVQKYAVNLPPGHLVRSGEFVSIRPAYVMTHDNTAAVMSNIGVPRFKDSRQVVFTLDHNIQDQSEKNLAKYHDIQSFAAEHQVDFYPAGRGIGHQVMIEEGYASPNTLVVASDSHSNMYGGIGALGTPIVRSDAAAIWATGRTWWQVPPVVKCELKGRLPLGITGKDVIIGLCGLFNKDEVLNAAIEFHGEGVRHLTVDERLSIANMTTEWGALAGLFPVDEVTLDWLQKRSHSVEAYHRSKGFFQNHDTVPTLRKTNVHPRLNASMLRQWAENPLVADPKARYAKHVILDLSTITDPLVAGPNSVKVMKPLSELVRRRIPIQKAYLVSCVNSRESDLAEAARVFELAKSQKGQAQVKKGIEFYVAAASSNVQASAEASGVWRTLMEAGARPLPPGCGPCIGLGTGLLKDGEVGISATNRNFKGRMGSRLADAYLASPAVVAASAIEGLICGPQHLLQNENTPSSTPIKYTLSSDVEASAGLEQARVQMLPGFSSSLEGRILFCPVDNLNTDGIYPGKYTYREDLSPSEMAKVAMENYDGQFSSIVRQGDILVAGLNFGSGSSREQAATSLKYAGIQLVLAVSFSETFKRNALNNGLVCLEAPELAQDLFQWSKKQHQARLTFPMEELKVSVHYDTGKILVSFPAFKDDFRPSYRIPALGQIAQELVLAGGLETWVKRLL